MFKSHNYIIPKLPHFLGSYKKQLLFSITWFRISEQWRLQPFGEGATLNEGDMVADREVKRFNMKDYNCTSILVMANLNLSNKEEENKVDATLFKQIVGSHRYICNVRPDINYGVGLVSRFMHDPRQTHLTATKHILRYLKGTANLSLFFPKKFDNTDGALEAWCDSDWSAE